MPQRALKRSVSKLLVVFFTIALAGSARTVEAQGQAVPHGIKGQTTVFNYPDFSDISGLTLNGNAATSDDFLQVGQLATYRIGSVFYTEQVNVAEGFTTAFTLWMVPGGSYTTADGMAFVIQNSGVNALGDNTGGPGYQGMANSLAVEFDTFMNDQLGDPNNNHVGVQSCGTAPNSLDHTSQCNFGLQAHLPVELARGKPFQVTITYAPANSGSELSISINNQLVLTSAVHLDALLDLNGNDAWVGFTAGSGAFYEAGYVRNWMFSSTGTAK
jgi:Legume lectin domain